MSRLNYTNQGAIRNLPLTNSLEDAIDLAVLDVYGPGYVAKVYSGGQPTSGKRRTGSHRHDEGKAGDFHIFGPDGQQVKGDDLAPIIQYWSAKKIGGVGAEMKGGGIHLDEHATPPKGGGMFWDYQNQGGRLTPKQREAYLAGKEGQLPALVERKPPPFVPNREQGLNDDVLHTAALTLLGEAAGEGRKGQEAVGHVINNRVASSRYPNDPKSVMLQNKQFSTWNKGAGGNNPDKRFKRTDPAYLAARATAADVLSGRTKDPTNGGLAYFAGKDPYWLSAENKNGTKKIGNHTFLLGKGEQPTTALAAIESLSPTAKAVVPALGYSPSPPDRPSTARRTTRSKQKGPSFFDKVGGYNNFKKLERQAAPSTLKVASAVGNSILDTGQNLWGGAQKALTPQKPVNLPRPRPTRTASVNPVALPRPRPQQDPRFDFSSMGNQSSPALQMALDMKVASLNNPIPSQPKIATPRSTRNFDRAEAGFNVPYTRQVGKATINPIDPIQPIQQVSQPNYLDPVAPRAPARPAGLGGQMNGLQRTVNNVRGALAPIRNVRHDIAGQIDGLKLAARRAAQQQIQQALGNRPSHMMGLDRAASSGNVVHSNGYIYAGSPGNFRQVGKVQGNDAKMYSTSNEKPKGYRYYDQIEKEWKHK
ncbi:cell wall hydrolase [Maritalea porphyrae]|uniref:cell wall hydrolase n=1 Tax=Maritalea porphyrae TaxID=880732 RepID=UPI0022AFBA72|nr:cell wall hydrolase [Maritalea porphyrae]MCZ4270876.1 cell wall hydrolase [Maritalea porphyrae]